ncbi:hypothetical protein C8K38_11257 [Rhodococcus sp. OK611]|nr:MULTISPECIES: hypothetical protein [unclassified Rhodococcus (in: high G+C Gram-positive bacteria)]PTR41174.1 hypothetical protein C8K38_11257 [Rhodococcus sp. OK611]SNX91996.1 hypothetical protein SAMN05447004_11257 [Rhodococcus sp. OK270]
MAQAVLLPAGVLLIGFVASLYFSRPIREGDKPAVDAEQQRVQA